MHRKLVFTSVVCLLALCGCRDSRQATVAGSVSLDSKPLVEGLVTFRPTPQTAGPEFSGIVSQGNYRVPVQVMPGEYQVDVRSWQKTGRMLPGQFGQKVEEIANVIPQKYFGTNTTLKAAIESGENRVDFTLVR